MIIYNLCQMIRNYVERVNFPFKISESSKTETPSIFIGSIEKILRADFILSVLKKGIIPLSSLPFWQDHKNPSTNGHNDLSKKTCARPIYRQKGIASLTARTNITTCALQSEDYNSQKDRKTSQKRKRTR